MANYLLLMMAPLFGPTAHVLVSYDAIGSVSVKGRKQLRIFEASEPGLSCEGGKHGFCWYVMSTAMQDNSWTGMPQRSLESLDFGSTMVRRRVTWMARVIG